MCTFTNQGPLPQKPHQGLVPYLANLSPLIGVPEEKQAASHEGVGHFVPPRAIRAFFRGEGDTGAVERLVAMARLGGL
jgi:hypothetical protein